MKEINNIINYFETLDKSIACAFATVIHVEGSSYRRVGARMLVSANGQWRGGISGGCLEGDALSKAQMVINRNKSKQLTYDTRAGDDSAIGVGLGCNGLINILIAPIDRHKRNNPIRVLRDCAKNRKVHVIITVIESPNDYPSSGSIFTDMDFIDSFLSDDSDKAYLQEAIYTVQARKNAQVVTVNKMRILIEYLAPPIHLIVFGGQYDVLPLLELKQFLGWKATLICKVQKTNPKALNLADKILNQRADFELPPIDDYTVAILMAHDYETDKANLERLLKISNLPYIGMLGPRKRALKIGDELGIDIFQTASNIFSPIGLDTGATTPEEIAIAIVAEIRSFFSKRNGQSLKFRESTIHARSFD